MRACSFARLKIPPLQAHMPTMLKKICQTHRKPIINYLWKGSWSPAHGVLQSLHTRTCIASQTSISEIGVPAICFIPITCSLFQQSKRALWTVKTIPCSTLKHFGWELCGERYPFLLSQKMKSLGAIPSHTDCSGIAWFGSKQAKWWI